MSWWWGFAIGAAIGCLKVGEKVVSAGSVIASFAVASALGGLVIGTLLWLISRLF